MSGSFPVLPRIVWTLVLGRGRPLLFLAVIALAVVCGRYALDARQDESNASMNSHGAQERLTEERFRADFGDNEVLLVAVTAPDLLGATGLATVRNVTERVGRLEGVRRATSITNVQQIVRGPYGAMPAPLLPERAPGGEPDTDAVGRALDANPHLGGLLISEDRKTAAIVVEVEERLIDDDYRSRLVAELHELERQPWPGGAELHVSGITLQKNETTRLVRRDQAIILPLSILMLALALAVVTRHLAGVLLPLVVTGITVVVTLGLYSALGFEVNIITSLLPPLLLVLSTTTAIHLFQEWAGPERRDDPGRLQRILTSLVTPCFLTALTTAIGLGSLVSSEIPAVRLFGAFGAFGILLAFGLCFTLLPALLSLFDPPAAPRRLAATADAPLQSIARFAVRRPGATFLAAGVPTLIALIAFPRISNNTDLLRFLTEDTKLVRDTRFIDSALGGANTIDFVIARADGSALTTLDDIDRLDSYVEELRSVPGIAGAFGVTDLLKQLHRAEQGLDRLMLPAVDEDLALLFDLLDAAEDKSDIRRVVTPDFRRTRLSVRMHAVGTREAAALLARIDDIGRERLGAGYSVTPTGAFYRVTVDSNGLVAGQMRSFGLALGLVLAVVGLTLRSARLLVAAILPNLVPIVWTMGLMGWLGIDLSTATTMVASVVLGIAVDDAIHYLARFRREYRGNLEEAVLRTTGSTGRVLTVTTVVLTLGFWIGALSSFAPTVQFSLLAGTSMVTALACTITLLPACLRVLHVGREVER